MLGQSSAGRYLLLDSLVSLWPSLSALIFTSFCSLIRMVWSFTPLLSRLFLQQPCTAFDFLSKHQWFVARGALTTSLIDWKLIRKTAVQIKWELIDLSPILNDHFLRKALGIFNLKTFKKLQFVQLTQKEGAHWLWLRCLDPRALFVRDSSWNSAVPVTWIIPWRCAWKWVQAAY